MNPNERSSHPSATQIEALVEFLEQNPSLAKGFLKTQHAREVSRRRWEEVSVRLNCMGGAIKSSKQWTKYWSDKKSALKKKVAAYAAARQRTGGGVEDIPLLSELEERMVALCGGGSFSTGDPQLGVLPFPTSNVQPEENEVAEDVVIEFVEPEQTDPHPTPRRFSISQDTPVAGTSQNIVQVSPQFYETLSPTLSHTPTPFSLPVTSPPRAGGTTRTTITASTSSSASFIVRPRLDAGFSLSCQEPQPTLQSPVRPPLAQSLASPSLRGATPSSRRTVRVRRNAGSPVSRRPRAVASPPAQRRTEFSRVTERFLRVAEQQVEVQQSNAQILQTLLDHNNERDARFLRVAEQQVEVQQSNAQILQTLLDHNNERDARMIDALSAIGEQMAVRLCERDRILGESMAAVGEGLKALAEIAKAFNPNK